MKAFILTLLSFFLLSSSSISYDDRSVFLSPETSKEIFIVEIYNREADAKATVAISGQETEQDPIIIKPQQIATIYLDKTDTGKKGPVIGFILPSGEEAKLILPFGKPINKNTPPKFNDKVYICLENGAVAQLSSEQWYEKLNKDREPSLTDQTLMLVAAPITVPVFLASYMVITLTGSFIE